MIDELGDTTAIPYHCDCGAWGVLLSFPVAADEDSEIVTAQYVTSHWYGPQSQAWARREAKEINTANTRFALPYCADSVEVLATLPRFLGGGVSDVS